MHPVYLAVTPLLNTLALTYFVLINAYHTRVLACAAPAQGGRCKRIAAQCAIVASVFIERWSVYAGAEQQVVYLCHCLRSTIVLATYMWVHSAIEHGHDAATTPSARELTLIF